MLSHDQLQPQRALQGFLPKYFSDEKSLAQFRLEDDAVSVVGFSGAAPCSLAVVTHSGAFYLIQVRLSTSKTICVL